MFGIFDREEIKTLGEELKRTGEFEFWGHRFKNEKNGNLYVWENDRWVPIYEAVYNVEKELAETLSKSLFGLREDESDADQENEEDPEDEDDFEDIGETFKEIAKVTDVSVNDYNVTCTFRDGQKYTAFCHPKDRPIYSLDTGIMVCLLKRFAGGTKPLNEALNQALGVYEEKQKRIEEEKKRRENEKKNKKKKAWSLLLPKTGYLTLQPGSIHIRYNDFDDEKVADLMTGLSDLIKGFHE